jgi:gamma-glutamyltranspeptidase/glutathione hydrolase
MRRMDGLVTLEDLEEFPSPEPVPPLRCRFGNLDVYTMPPPGGGTALIQMLNMFDAIAEASFDPDSGDGCHLLAELIRQSRRDRVRYRLKIGAEEVGGAADLIDPDYARTRAETIRVRIPGTGETSHISVADRHGNMVSMTQSIERSFGAAEISPSLGFLCNGFLRAFKIRNRQHPHFLSPGTPARSNACPTVVLDGTEPWCAVGNTGSERLASGILQVLARLRSQSPFESVLAPRIHATPERILMYEDRLQPGALHRLGEAGYRLERHGPYSFKFGGLNLVVRQQDAFVGVAEPRRDGTAAGPEAWPSSVVDSQAD